MKTKLFTLTAAALAFLASQASAISFNYSDYRDVDTVKQLLSNNSTQGASTSASGVFDIVSDDDDLWKWDRYGFKPGQEVITGAQVAFGFFYMGTETPTYLGSVDYFLGAGLTPFSGGSVEDQGSSEFDFTLVSSYLGDITGALLLDLEDDGRLAWKVEVDQQFGGEVMLWWAAIAADAQKVPDSGSTAALFGFSIFAALVVRRRLTA